MSFSKPILETYLVPLDGDARNYPAFDHGVLEFAMSMLPEHSPHGLAHLVTTPQRYHEINPDGPPTYLTPGEGGPDAGHYDRMIPSTPFGTMSIETWKWHDGRYKAFTLGEVELKKCIIAAIGTRHEGVIHGNAPTKMLLFNVAQIMDKLRAAYDVATQARLDAYQRVIATKFNVSSGVNIQQFVSEHHEAYLAKSRMLNVPVDLHAHYISLRAAFSNNANLVKSLADRYDYDFSSLLLRNVDNLTAYVLEHFPALVAQPDPYAAQAVEFTPSDTAVTNATLQTIVAAAVAEAMSIHAKSTAAPSSKQQQPQGPQTRPPAPKASLPDGVCYCYRHGYSAAAGHNGRTGHWGTDCFALRNANAPESQKKATAHRLNADGTASGSWKGFSLV